MSQTQLSQLGYNTKDKYEVDFIITRRGLPENIIRVYYDEEKLPKRELQEALRAAKELKLNKTTVITWNLEKTILEDDIEITVIPLFKWLLE